MTLTVLVGLSRSPEGAAALDRGAEEARLRGALLRVVELEPGAAAATTLPPGAEVLTLPERQDPAEGLIDAAAGPAVVLVVIGARRRSPVGKFLLGSWAQRVVLDAEVPVLVVKAPAG